MSNEAVNSAQIAMLIKSDQELKEIISENARADALHKAETNQILNRLLEAVVRSEERQISDKEWQKRVDAHQDKQDVKIELAQATADQAKNQALSNGKWINGAVFVVTSIFLILIENHFDILGGP